MTEPTGPLPFRSDLPAPRSRRREPLSLGDIQEELFPGVDDDQELGFLARAFIAATLPHSALKSSEFVRECPFYRLTLMAPSAIGLPYGVYPRRALAWLTTNAARLKSPTLSLGPCLSNFAYLLGITPTSSTLAPLRDQLSRLFETTVSCLWDNTSDPDAVNPSRSSPGGFRIAFRYHLWWSEPAEGLPNFVTLSTDFYNEIIDRPVPLDLTVIKSLRSPMHIDVYAWLCWRSFRSQRLGRPELISWEKLESQFGADYAETRLFRFYFKKALTAVFKHYPEVRVEATTAGLRLFPYPPHVRPRPVSLAPRLIGPTKR
jgi:hypothetical protein